MILEDTLVKSIYSGVGRALRYATAPVAIMNRGLYSLYEAHCGQATVDGLCLFLDGLL